MLNTERTACLSDFLLTGFASGVTTKMAVIENLCLRSSPVFRSKTSCDFIAAGCFEFMVFVLRVIAELTASLQQENPLPRVYSILPHFCS